MILTIHSTPLLDKNQTEALSSPNYARPVSSERIRMSGTGPRSGRTMSEFRHNLIITVSDQNQNCKGTQSMITNSLCIPIISNFHHWFLDSHQNFSWELFQREKDGGCARRFLVQKFSVLFCSVSVARKALLSPFMTNFINNQSGMSSLTLTNLMICTSIVKNLINFLPLEKKR